MTTKRRLPFLQPRLSLVLLFALATITPGAAHAEGKGTYVQLVQQAVIESNLGNFEEAHALFRQAHALEPNARTWRGLGVCAFELRLYVETTADLEAALVDVRKPLTPVQREEAKQLLERARAFVSVYHLRVRPAGAQVIVDGKPAALRDATLRLDPGRHVILVRAPGYAEQHIELPVGAGIEDELNIDLAGADNSEVRDQAAGAPSSLPVESGPKQRTKRRRVWTWSLAVSAVALAAVAVGLRVSVNGLHDDFLECTSEGGDCSDFDKSVQSRLLGSRISGAAAGALGIASVITFFFEGKPGATPTSASVALGPESLLLRGTF